MFRDFSAICTTVCADQRHPQAHTPPYSTSAAREVPPTVDRTHDGGWAIWYAGKSRRRPCVTQDIRRTRDAPLLWAGRALSAITQSTPARHIWLSPDEREDEFATQIPR